MNNGVFLYELYIKSALYWTGIKKLISPRDFQGSRPLQNAVTVSTHHVKHSHYTSALVTFGKLYTDTV